MRAVNAGDIGGALKRGMGLRQVGLRLNQFRA
jgi:hypothetical protein